MRKYIYLLINLIIIEQPLFSQNISNNSTYEQLIIDNALPALSVHDMELLKRLPEIRVPALYKSAAAPLLPSSVDNSTQPYMRPVFSQVSLECGQASGIGYNFTYEMNYRRNLSANFPQNQYPPHYVYNFSNNGAACGVSFLESWEIIRGAGTVNVADYGGMSPIGVNYWLTGYDRYYNAMKNRIDEIYSIPVSTADGIQILKHWIHDHLEGAAIGGVANFAACATSAVTLPNGTPEAGKCVTVNWTPSINHQLVIVGYNDSIRYDFNGDGLYTNDIDINGDGVVDVKDWEIGGVKWVNSFGTGTGNNGYCYTMYKNLADPKNLGGIWNNTVYVIVPKPDYEPRLTYRINITDNNRSKLKVMAGVSADTSAQVPEHIMEFPVFNYQGGDYFMQGGTTDNALKTIEFGLDVTPLLSFVNTGETAKFFLLVNEKDPDNVATGSIVAFSLIDYTPSPIQVNCQSINVPIINNGLTMMNIKRAVSYPVVTISDTSLPNASLYQPYSHQLTATGGSPPYDWELVMDYHENTFQDVFINTGTEQLIPVDNNGRQVAKSIPFNFPFYGKNYNRLVIHIDGYIMFDDQPLPWPFIIDEGIYQRNTRNIAPFMSKIQTLVASDGDGIWYEGDQNSVTIRWKTSISGETATTDLNYSVTLYPDGSIVFHYGNISVPYWLSWVAGISSGDLFNSLVAGLSGSLPIPVGTTVQFSQSGFPVGLQLSKTGLLSGTMNTVYNNAPVKLLVRDKNDIRCTKTLNFTSEGIEIQPIIISGGDSLIQYGETAFVGMKLKNASGLTLVNPVFHLRLNNSFLTPTDSVETIGIIEPGDTMTLLNCFSFNVSNSVPNNLNFKTKIYTLYNTDTLGRDFTFKAWSPVIAISGIQVVDAGNGYLDPGETTNILVTIANTGGAEATGLNGVFSTIDPYLTINSFIGNIPNLMANGSGIMVINVTASPQTPANHLTEVNLQISGDNQITNSSIFYLIIGFCGETFESNDFNLLNWNLAGDAPWFICDSLPYEGQYCAQSGDINDYDESILFVNLNIQTPGNVSFYHRVSCEQDINNHNYDYLAFYIDNYEKERWDGETGWVYSAYPVTVGNHTFKWNYHKDYSVSAGKDAAWVDMITFPAFGDIISFTGDQIRELTASCMVIPNPFHKGATFFFHQSLPGKVSLKVYNIQGKEVTGAFSDQSFNTGDQMLHWNNDETFGTDLVPGIYFYSLSTPARVFTGKLIKY